MVVIFPLVVLLIFLLVESAAITGGQPFKRMYYTKRRRVRNELHDLKNEIDRCQAEPMNPIEPGISFKLQITEARARLLHAKMAFSAGRLDQAKESADHGLDALVPISLHLSLALQKRSNGIILGECSMLEHYKSGRYKP